MSTALYRIEHETSYQHAGRASTSQHIAYLRPRELPNQRVLAHELRVDPAPSNQSERTDYFGNTAHHFTILTPYDEMRAISRSLVNVAAPAAPALDVSEPWEDVRDSLLYRRDAAYEDAVQFSYPSPYAASDPALVRFARQSFEPRRSLLDAAIDLMHRIHREFVFDPKATSVTTPATRVLEERHGVCQDFAHLQIASMRSLGLPARYMSGYLLTDPPPGQRRLIGADASHAWLAVWCPKQGWVALDPTNGLLPSLRHIVLAWGRDYGDVSPLRGVVLGGQDHTLQVAVSVTPVAAGETLQTVAVQPTPISST
jgi:transglutaminase-like putative cysteine protease